MVRDLGSAQVHDLGEVDLVAAVEVRPGVFPHQGLAVEVVPPGAIPADEVVGAVVGAALAPILAQRIQPQFDHWYW